MRRRWIGPGLSLASVLLGLGFLAGCELLLRWIRPGFLHGAPVEQPHIYSEVYGWALRPDFRGRWANGKSFSINRAAYRGRAWTGPPPPRTTRVVMLGDSVAFGTGVDDRETFSEVLQETLPELEVANLAVSGYGTDQELLRLEHEGFSLQPNVVMLHFCMANDLVDNMLDSYLYDGRTPKPYYVLTDEGLSLRTAHLERKRFELVGVRLRERSYLFDSFFRFAQPTAPADGLLDGVGEGHWVGRRNHVLMEFEKAVDLTLRLLRRAGDLCRERGVRFLLVLHPDRPSFLGEGRLTALFHERRPELEGIDMLDLQRSYAAAGVDFDTVASDKIGHLNPYGHAFVADVLRKELPRPAGGAAREGGAPLDSPR
jgi:hypothetical protein